MDKLWILLVVDPLIIVWTMMMGVVSAAIALFGMRTAPAQIAVARMWSRVVLSIAGVQVDVEGLEHLERRGPYVFTANHLSYIDTPVVLKSIPVQFRFLAKEELFQFSWLVIAWHLKTAGHVPVPLDNPRAAVRTLSHTAKLIESDGTSVFFFSEGGRSEDGTLQEFKDGAAYIAIKAHAPLVPVALMGPREILPMGSLLVRRGRVKVRIGEPISTEGLTLKDRGALTERSREELVGMLNGMTSKAST